VRGGGGAVPPDRIELRGLRVLGTHGLLDEERQRPQPFEVDLDVVADLSAAVARVVGEERCDLLERLATRIAEVVLTDARVTSVTVAVRKLRPPVPVDLASAGVRITRSRDGRGSAGGAGG